MTAGRGLLISIDGPCGVGKTSTARALGQLLLRAGVQVHLTAEPTSSDIGALARSRVHTDTTGHALACLFAADRYQHLHAEIRPRLAAGDIVVADRYTASALVMQRLDGVELDFLRGVNRHIDPPDLAVILVAHPNLIQRRLHHRGARNRYQKQANISAMEADYYQQAAHALRSDGVNVLQLATSKRSPRATAQMINIQVRQLMQRTGS